MSAAERKAVVQECLDLSHWYRSWATLKHGLPDKQHRNSVGDEPTPEPPQIIPIPYITEKMADSMKESATTTSAPTVPPAPNWRNRLLAGLLGAGLLAGTGTAAGVAGWLANSGGKQAPPAVAPAPPVGPAYGDLLQWLDQEGYNVPPATPGGSP